MDIEKTKVWISKSLQKESSSDTGLEEAYELTIELLKDLRCIFEHYLKAFDEIKSENPKNIEKERMDHSIFIYNLSQTEGFMLFKKSFKLIFSYIKPGQIRIKFLTQRLLNKEEILEDTYLNLIYNNTLSVNWALGGKKGFVSPEILTRYYMKRFLEEK